MIGPVRRPGTLRLGGQGPGNELADSGCFIQKDAATLKGSSSSQVMTIDDGGAQKADDKVSTGVVIKAATGAIDVCQRYTGNDTGAEPPKLGAGNDGKVCIYSATDVTWQP